MKTTIGVFAVLMLVTTFAIGQQYQEPFPQSANPALANGTVRGASAFGLRVLRCNRFDQVPERIPETPDAQIATLDELPDIVLG
jgi:hypothetical protein